MIGECARNAYPLLRTMTVRVPLPTLSCTLLAQSGATPHAENLFGLSVARLTGANMPKMTPLRRKVAVLTQDIEPPAWTMQVTPSPLTIQRLPSDVLTRFVCSNHRFLISSSRKPLSSIWRRTGKGSAFPRNAWNAVSCAGSKAWMSACWTGGMRRCHVRLPDDVRNNSSPTNPSTQTSTTVPIARERLMLI